MGFGVRCTLGVAIPLVLALLAHAPLAGVSGAIGAMSAGFASRQGVYRTRAAAMVLTSAAMAVSGYVGAFGDGRAVLSVVLLALWGMGLGILGSLGAAAVTVGLNSVIALVIFGNPPYGPQDALPQAMCVLGGGLVQTALQVLIWPVQRFRAERRALAQAYRALADYASHLPEGELGSPAATALEAAIQTLDDPQPFARRAELALFESLRDEAERLRATLATFATDRHLLDRDGYADAAATVQHVSSAAVPILGEIASAIEDGRAPADLGTLWHEIDLRVGALEQRLRALPLGTHTVGDAREFLAELRTAWRAAGVPADRRAASPARPTAPQPFALSALGDAFETLRANLSPRSLFARHAVRLALTLAIAGILERTLPLKHAYWIALTSVIVLRPGFVTTYRMGLQRVAGTVIGAVLASIVTVFVRTGHDLYLWLAILAAALGYTLFSVNYAVFSICITAYVVFLLSFAGAPSHAAAFDRVAATLIGGALAIVAYTVWPTWSRERVPDELADLLDAQRRYIDLILAAYADPEHADLRPIVQAQREAWRARTAAEASVEEMRAEPVRPRALGTRAAERILAASRRFAVASLTLHARLPRALPVRLPALAAFARELDAALLALEHALREQPDFPPLLPSLRDTQIGLKSALDAAPDPNLAAVVSETDLLVEAIQTIDRAIETPA